MARDANVDPAFFGGLSVAPDGSVRVAGRFENATVLGFGDENETTLIGSGQDQNSALIARFNADGAF